MKYRKKQEFRRSVLWAMAVLSGVATLLVACSRELTPEYAFRQISEQGEFRMPYYAPMRIGEQVLTGENHKQSQQYVRKQFGSLIDAGLVEVKTTDRNMWRTVIDVQLTEKGRAMSDPRRAKDKEAYVQVCRMVPVRIEEFRTVAEGKVVECSYCFEEQDITPFGHYKGFKQGRSYKDKRTFVRSRGSWQIQ
ncbi:MAG: hypothetical protein K2K83_04880 [Rikenella sp.]|nr:hypothetical protein [Rikenella sp.]